MGGTGTQPFSNSSGNFSGPDIQESQIAAATLNGQAFNVCMPNAGAGNGASGNLPFQIFNPTNSGVKLLVYSINVCSGAASPIFLQYVTSETTYNTSTPITNAYLGNLTAAAFHSTYASAVISPASGNTIAVINFSSPGTQDLLPSSSCLILPPGYGLQVWSNLSAFNNWAVNLWCLQFS
jgi:hypothetical protein